MSHARRLLAFFVVSPRSPPARADAPSATDRDREIVVTIDEVKGIAAPFPGHLMFYAPNLTSADVGSDGTPASPVFVVDEKTPQALVIVPVGAPGGGHTHGAP